MWDGLPALFRFPPDCAAPDARQVSSTQVLVRTDENTGRTRLEVAAASSSVLAVRRSSVFRRKEVKKELKERSSTMSFQVGPYLARHSAGFLPAKRQPKDNPSDWWVGGMPGLSAACAFASALHRFCPSRNERPARLQRPLVRKRSHWPIRWGCPLTCPVPRPKSRILPELGEDLDRKNGQWEELLPRFSPQGALFLRPLAGGREPLSVSLRKRDQFPRQRKPIQ